MDDLHARLNDADVQKVIARALELQAKSTEELTIAQIREIASELAIPASAVDQALSEYQAAAEQGSSRSKPVRAPSIWDRGRVARRIVTSVGWVGGALVLAILISVMMRL